MLQSIPFVHKMPQPGALTCDRRFILLMWMCVSLSARRPLEKYRVRKAGLETRTGDQTAVTLRVHRVTHPSPMCGKWALQHLELLLERPRLYLLCTKWPKCFMG